MDSEKDKLDKLVLKSRRVLLEIKAVFPFDFFPDKIKIDENKVDIISSNFFFDKHIASILIEHINTVTLSSGVLFASISF